MPKADHVLPEPRELRAFEVFDHVPAGCELVVMRDGSHKPHLREGEFAIADLNDTTFVSGEVYLVDWGKDRFGNDHRSVCQVKLHMVPNLGPEGPFPGIYFHPLCGPKFLPNGKIDLNGPLFLSDGPLRPEYLPRYLKGRIVGIFQAPHNDMWKRPALRMIGKGDAS